MNDSRTVLQLGTHTPHTLSSTLTHMYLYIYSKSHTFTHTSQILSYSYTLRHTHVKNLFLLLMRLVYNLFCIPITKVTQLELLENAFR